MFSVELCTSNPDPIRIFLMRRIDNESMIHDIVCHESADCVSDNFLQKDSCFNCVLDVRANLAGLPHSTKPTPLTAHWGFAIWVSSVYPGHTAHQS